MNKLYETGKLYEIGSPDWEEHILEVLSEMENQDIANKFLDIYFPKEA